MNEHEHNTSNSVALRHPRQHAVLGWPALRGLPRASAAMSRSPRTRRGSSARTGTATMSGWCGPSAAKAARPQLQQILTDVTNRLVMATDRPDETFQVTILNSPVVNAFALPNGRLYVTRGLLALANDTSEVAAVLSHEIAHVTLRHASQRSELQARSDLIERVAENVLNDAEEAAVAQSQARFALASFSRAQELEADQMGVKVLARAGFDPYGAPRFLTALGRSGSELGRLDRRNANASHPRTDDRVARALQAARRSGIRDRGDGAPRLHDGPRRARLWRRSGRRRGAAAAASSIRASASPSRRPRALRWRTHPRPCSEPPATAAGACSSTPQTRRTGRASRRCCARPGTTPSSRAARTTPSTACRWHGPVDGKEWSFRLSAIRIGGTTYRLIMAAPRQQAISKGSSSRLWQQRPAGSAATKRGGSGRSSCNRHRRARAIPRKPRRPDGGRRPSLERFLLLNGLDRNAALKPSASATRSSSNKANRRSGCPLRR